MIKNFVLETCNAPGTSTTINLAGAPTGRTAWLDAYASGSTVYYVLNDGTLREWGIGTVTSGAPNTLSRTTVLGNSAGTTARLNFTGATSVYNDVPAERRIYQTSSGVSLDTGIINASAWAGVSSGTSTAYTLTVTPTPTAYAAGQVIRWRAHTACGASPTVAVGALGAKNLRIWMHGLLRGLQAGMIVAGSIVEMVYDDDSGTFIVLSRLAGADPWQTVSRSDSGSSVATVEFALPTTNYGVYMLDIEYAVPSANAVPFLRFSVDGGSTYQSGATDYTNALATISTTAVGSSGGTAAQITLGATQLSTHQFQGQAVFRSGTPKSVRLDGIGITTSTLPYRYTGASFCSVSGAPTHVQFGFLSANVSQHIIRLLGARFT